MTKQEVKENLSFEGETTFKMNGVEITFDAISETFFNKVWKSANVIKNRRQSQTGGIKTIIGNALKAKLVNDSEALQIILLNDKAKAKELAEQMTPEEKTEEPSDDDVKQAIELVATGGGQSVSI